MYKNNVPKNQIFGMKYPASAPLLDDAGVCTSDAPSESLKTPVETSNIASYLDNIMSLPEDEYKDVYEITSPRLIVNIKAAVDSVPGKQDYTPNLFLSFFNTLFIKEHDSGIERNTDI